jgi:hypothetical protein
MRTRILLTAAAFALLGAPAFAQQAPDVEIDQLQWGDVFASMTVESRNSQGSAASVATAAGNTASGANMTGDMHADVVQINRGSAGAEALVDADDACCETSAIATAQNNALEAQTKDGDLILWGDQIATGGESNAFAKVNVGNTQRLQAASSAAANNAALAVTDGDLTILLPQDSENSIRARTDVDACCTGLTLAGATASANALSTTSSTSTVSAGFEQNSRGAEILAATDVYQYLAHDVTASSTAAANSATIANQWGYVSLRGKQLNESEVIADTRVTLGSWQGTAVSSAHGVGNTILATNVGSDLVVDVNQTNSGGVSSFASFNGGANADQNGGAVVNASAIGNGFTGYVCSYCGDAAATGTVNQTNSGNINSTGVITASGASSAFGAASAIGNSATFITATNQN